MIRTIYHVRKKDLVQVMSGKEKGKTGKVMRVIQKKGRVVVEKLNMVKRHTKPTAKNRKGGIVLQEEFIDLSNVQIVCKTCNRATRVGHRFEGGVKIRVCRKCGAEL